MQKEHLLNNFYKWEDVFEAWGEKKFRAKQLASWIFGQLKDSFEEMPNLPHSLVTKLTENSEICTLKVSNLQLSLDGTAKWLLKTNDNHFIECVLIPDENRYSACLSSQVGCGIGCKFCSTAKMGFIRNLTVGEILEQFFIIQKYVRQKTGDSLTNVIFMGMGEPLHNIDSVGEACRIISSPNAFGLSKRKITVSTSGLIPSILKWAHKYSDFKLALSLNGTNNEVRSSLMPINGAYPIEKLLSAVDEYIHITGQRITFEYILIKDLTCNPKAARALLKIASARKCKVNLIPFNGGADGPYQPPETQAIREFEKILSSGNFPVMLRKPRGRDIAAACGQLVQLEKKVA